MLVCSYSDLDGINAFSPFKYVEISDRVCIGKFLSERSIDSLTFKDETEEAKTLVWDQMVFRSDSCFGNRDIGNFIIWRIHVRENGHQDSVARANCNELVVGITRIRNFDSLVLAASFPLYYDVPVNTRLRDLLGPDSPSFLAYTAFIASMRNSQILKTIFSQNSIYYLVDDLHLAYLICEKRKLFFQDGKKARGMASSEYIIELRKTTKTQ